MNIAEAAAFYNELLNIGEFAADPSHNGLQLCGNAEKKCSKIAFAVDACLSSIEKAVAEKADMLVVHHGLSWGGEPRRWNGMTGKRMQEMFKNDLALYAMHLPLDAHGIYGNNACLADLIDLQDREKFFAYHGMEIGFIGNTVPAPAEEIAARAACGKEFKLYAPPGKNSFVGRAAIVSGGGGMESLEEAIANHADMLITGEFDHTMYHVVQENDIYVAALGHYNSEVHGVKSLMKVAQEKLFMQTVFLDIPTGL